MLHKGRRWVQPAKAARILGMSPHYLKKLIYNGEIDGFEVLKRKSENGKVYHWLALDEILRATNGVDLSRGASPRMWQGFVRSSSRGWHVSAMAAAWRRGTWHR